MANSFGEQRSTKRQRVTEPPEDKKDKDAVKRNHVEQENPPEVRPRPKGKTSCVSYEERTVIKPEPKGKKKSSKKKQGKARRSSEKVDPSWPC